MNDQQKAQLWLNKAKDYPAHTLEDKEVRLVWLWPRFTRVYVELQMLVSLQVHKEAVDLLKKLG